jgi:tetratricopeptide (TPR) repeat protein
LLIGAAGCVRHDTTLPVVPPPAQTSAAPGSAAVPENAVPPGAVVKKLELPKREPTAPSCVAAGDYFAGEAAADASPAFRQARFEQARKAYEQALSIDPHYLSGYLSLAKLYIAVKDHADAETTYRRAAQMCPKEGRVFFEMALCYGGQKQWEQAILALRHAVQLDPKNRPYVDELGWMQARAGHFDDSLATFRTAYDESEAQLKVAQMLNHLGDTAGCRQHLQAALMDPNMEREEQAKAKALLDQLNSVPVGDGVRTAAFVTSAKPAPFGVIPAAAMDPKPAAASPTAKSILLPPPPHFPIRYEQAPPVPAGGESQEPAALPPVPGPGQN